MRHYQPAVPAQSYPRFEAMKQALRRNLGLRSMPKHVPQRLAEAARSDTQIKQDVTDELRTEPSIETMSIGVAVKDGIVTLTGRADGYREKWLIETAARRIAGVKSLAVKLEVIVSEPGVRTDDDIGRECERALGVTLPGPNQSVSVMVSNGWVRLSGDVACGHERWTAEAVVSRLMGVGGVNSQIKVRPTPVEKAVNADSDAAITRQSEHVLHEVETRVDPDKASLTDTVHAWARAELRVMRPGLRLG